MIRQDKSVSTKRLISKEALELEVKEDIAILVDLGYKDVAYNSYSVGFMHQLKTYGVCHKDSKSNHYTIYLNTEYLKLGTMENIHTTIMHECCHSVKGCMNHGSKWKKVASEVNKFYNFAPITRTSYDKAYATSLDDKYKYIVKCKKCGAVSKWMRKGNLYKACINHQARCTICGSSDFEIICKK